ncbi:MAG TPA: hypothetical protein DCO73_12895 [Alphaproteobacteria bacterium]|nr:hypothetical protein [Alphaproteobacteria bacterium]
MRSPRIRKQAAGQILWEKFYIYFRWLYYPATPYRAVAGNLCPVCGAGFARVAVRLFSCCGVLPQANLIQINLIAMTTHRMSVRQSQLKESPMTGGETLFMALGTVGVAVYVAVLMWLTLTYHDNITES